MQHHLVVTQANCRTTDSFISLFTPGIKMAVWVVWDVLLNLLLSLIWSSHTVGRLVTWLPRSPFLVSTHSCNPFLLSLSWDWLASKQQDMAKGIGFTSVIMLKRLWLPSCQMTLSVGDFDQTAIVRRPSVQPPSRNWILSTNTWEGLEADYIPIDLCWIIHLLCSFCLLWF